MENINLWIAIGGAVLSVGTAWGIVTTRVKQVEARVDELDDGRTKDHDLLIEIRTKLDIIMAQKKGKQ